MFCPQCGTASSDGQQYCRTCGANLKFIGKAVSLSEAVARSDRGPLPKIKEVVQGLKSSGVVVGVKVGKRASEEKKTEADPPEPEHAPPPARKEVEAPEVRELRRENHLVKGTVSLFTGVGLMIFLYFFTAALVLKIPPDVLAKIPFEIEPVARMIWLIGLIPVMSGLGRITAGLLVRPSRRAIDGPAPEPLPEAEPRRIEAREPAQSVATGPARDFTASPPRSVTEGTTELLDREAGAPVEAQGAE